MKNIARRIIATIFPQRKKFSATIVYSGLTFNVCVDAPDERRALMELDVIADGGYVVSFAEA